MNATLCHSAIIVRHLHRILLVSFFLALMTILPFSQTAWAGQGKPTRAYQVYVVKNGDTLARIARRFGTSVRTIRRTNHLKSTHLRPGKRLKIPIKKTFASPANGKICRDGYRVRRGDTLHAIARRCGVSIAQLRALNHLGKTNRLRVGQLLRVPSENHGRGHDFLPVPGH